MLALGSHVSRKVSPVKASGRPASMEPEQFASVTDGDGFVVQIHPRDGRLYVSFGTWGFHAWFRPEELRELPS